MLKVGNEMIQMYHHVKNERELLRAFTAYEKLFAFQKNILDSKRDFLKNQLHETNLTYKQSLKHLGEVEMQNDEVSKDLEQQMKNLGENLSNVNEIYEKKIEATEKLISSINQINNGLGNKLGKKFFF